MDTLKLDGEFPPVTYEEWLKAAESVLKGADFNKVLVSRTYDDIAIQPLYKRMKNTAPEGRAAGATPWRIDQRIDHTDITAANTQMLEDQNGGAAGFVIVGREALSSRGFGLKLEKSEDLGSLLKGLYTDEFSLRLDAGEQGVHIATLLLDLIRQKKLPASHLTLDIGHDPIGLLASRGTLHQPVDKTVSAGADLIDALKKADVQVKTFLADGRPYHEAGASEGQELAAVLSAALYYLRRLIDLGMDIETARGSLSFLLVADADEFMTVAKFRALRRLWRKVEESCGLEAKPIRLHSETAWRMMTRYDPWTNLLRCTTAVFSAGVGGTDTLSVLPFTNALGLPDVIARRMARNIQLVLLNESNLWRVVDPAAGAGGFEALTSSLCEMAWKDFQEIEREGGIVESLSKGLLQSRISETARKRRQDLAVKKLKMTGISEFPDIHGEKVSVLAPIPKVAKSPPDGALVPHRDAEAFEALRDRVETHAEKTGKREPIFIAAIGSQAAYTGRATFARNFFEVAGIEAVMPDRPLTPENLAEVFAGSGAKLACIASSDDGYAEGAGAISKALAATDCRRIYLVCSKGLDPAWNVESAVEAVTPRSDALAVLEAAVDAALPTTAA